MGIAVVIIININAQKREYENTIFIYNFFFANSYRTLGFWGTPFEKGCSNPTVTTAKIPSEDVLIAFRIYFLIGLYLFPSIQ